LAGDVKNIVKVASIYAASVIGAGFASGREIAQFFSIYYEGGFYGIVFSGILFSVIGAVVLDKVYRERIRDYDEFVFPTMGWFMGWVIEIAATLFMLSVFCIMTAGSGNIIMEKLGIPFKYAIVLSSFIYMVIILTSIKGIVNLSTVVTPLMISGMIIVGLYIIVFKDTTVFSITGYFRNATKNCFFSSLLYVSYNSISSVIIMCSLLPYLKSRKTGIMGGILGGAVLCFVALVLNYCIFLFYPSSVSQELPMLSILAKYSNVLSIIYSIILWLAMMVSAVTSGYCFLDRVTSKIRINKTLATIVTCFLITPLSSMGFSKLISTIYPVFGYIGMFMVFIILFQGIKSVTGGRLKRKQNRFY